MTRSPARVALDTKPEAILERLPAMGRVMLVGRNDGVTHERIGPVGDVMARGGYARISGDCHDGALISLRVDKVVLDVSSTMKDKVFPRIEFMTKDGVAAASVVGMEGLEPFEAALADVARGAAEDAPPREAPGERQELADDDPARAPFEAAVASGAAVRIEFRGPSFTQRWQGRIEATRPAMGFLNVMTPDFHLHLKGGAVAEWRVETGPEGAALAAIGTDGAPIGLYLQADRMADLGHARADLVAHAPGTWIAPADGREIGHGALMAKMAQRQVVLLGETHDRADIHRWQLHVAAGILAHRRDVALGFEMFPRRVQPVLDRWAMGDLTETRFLEEVEWETVWGFPPELYLPLFRFCREFRLPMLALNCRRALVTEVGKLGWDAIPEADRDGLSPAKPASEAYRKRLFGRGAAGKHGADHMDPSNDRFVRAQQTWDRAFACNIAAALDGPKPPLVIGIIGRGHLDFGWGAAFQLEDLGYGPDEVATLLPNDAPEIDPAAVAGIGDALFRLAP